MEKDVSDKVYAESRTYVKRIYIFSILFGSIALPLVNLLSRMNISLMRNIYYALYIVIGIAGLVVCSIKKLKYTPHLLCLFFFFIMLTFYIVFSTVEEFLLYYVCFSFILITLLNINPFIFIISILLYDIILVALIRSKGMILSNYVNESPFYNIIVLNGLIIYLSFWKRKYVINKYKVSKEISQEKNKTEKLLLNTLPQKVMEDLRDNGKSVPKTFENTTVLYCAISNYKELTETVDSASLINLFNQVYEAFDSIIEKENCLRIKTTGNIYMAVCGLPVPDENHAEAMTRCAIEFINYIEKFNRFADVKVQVKIGLHSGKVVAGIVGIKKYIYDVFGDTVNVACRMEMLCDDMRIRSSADTYSLVKNQFSFEKQEAVSVKGKGMMESYYIAS